MSKIELRHAALSKLIEVKSTAVDERLGKAFSDAEKALHESTEYDELLEALKTLAVLVPRYHMAIMSLVTMFVRSLPDRTLTESGEPIAGIKLRYRSAGVLIREAIEVAFKLRYVHTETVVDFLLEMSRADDKDVSTRAGRAVIEMATFDLDIFYGDSQLGAQPQALIVAHLQSFQDESLCIYAGAVLDVLSTVLAPTIEGTSWSLQSMSIRRGSIGSDGGVAAMRADAIELAKRIYRLDDSADHRKRVLRSLNSATRRDGPANNPETSAMFERDALAVLSFMRDLVRTEVLPIVQSIEHQAYWNYYHAASQAIKEAALQVRDAIDSHAEYQIYKQLIGFEGIFGAWEDLSRSEAAWDYSDQKRREAARRYLEEINDTTHDEWRDRILEYSKTRSSDLAMFPVYHEFLESIGRDRPRLALELLTVYEESMAPFLIALMRGLWTSENTAEFESVVQHWMDEGRNLTSIAKSLYNVGARRLGVLKNLTDRAAMLDDRDALIQVVGVAASLFVEEGAANAKPIFMLSLRELSKRDDGGWANVIWFRRNLAGIVNAIEPGERAEMLASMATLPELDYQAEDILFEIAKHDLQAVLDFLLDRVRLARVLSNQGRKTDGGEGSRFEAIPYQLTKLNELLVLKPGMLLEALRKDFDEESFSTFSYRGARLVESTFPKLGEPLEQLLLKYVETSDDSNIKFVVGILRAYDGSAPVLGVCKAVIKIVPERSAFWNEIAAVIESTGVVTGEYGFVEAYEHKLAEISVWKDDSNSRVRDFAEWLTEGLCRTIAHERQRADEQLALRKYRYGEENSED